MTTSPAIDKRELILARILAALVEMGAPGIKTVSRNRGELMTDKRPSILLMDADETAFYPQFDKGQLKGVPTLVDLAPTIYLSLESRKPDNAGVGEALNELRAITLRTILLDAQLRALVGSNGQIRYEGCVTDLERDRAMEGEMGLRFTFRYVLNPTDL